MVRVLSVAMLVSASRADMSAVSLADVDSEAQCSDGSPARYYYKPTTAPDPIITCNQCLEPDECGCGYCGSSGGCSFTCNKDSSMPPRGQRCALGDEVSAVTEASRTWFVYLEGGDWCYDQESCNERCGDPNSKSFQNMCSSKTLPSTMHQDGVFWPDNNDVLKNAHKVFVKYCTSDAHMGDADGFDLPWGRMKFRGQVVVRAVLKHLVQSKGLGSGHFGRIDRLIFGGGSAGARGAMVHLDYVKEMLGQAAPNVDVIGFLDSPAWIDMPPYSGSNTNFPGFPNVTRQVHDVAKVQHLGRECLAQHLGEDQWKCMFGQYRLPMLQTPFFLVASQYDAYALGKSKIGSKPENEGELQYAEDFAARTRQLGESLVNKRGVMVYSWTRFNHCTACNHRDFDLVGTGAEHITMDNAFKQFMEHGWSNEPGEGLIQDICTPGPELECNTPYTGVIPSDPVMV